MLDISYKQTAEHKYLILKNHNKQEETDIAVRMIEENTIDGLLPVVLQLEESCLMYYYDISGMELLTSKYQLQTFSANVLYDCLTGILKALLLSSEYMMDIENYIIKSDMIYIASDNKIALIYYSDYHVPVGEQLKELARYLLDKTDYTDQRAIMIAYGFYQLVSKEKLTIALMLEGLTKLNPIIGQKEIKNSSSFVEYTDRFEEENNSKKDIEEEKMISDDISVDIKAFNNYNIGKSKNHIDKKCKRNEEPLSYGHRQLNNYESRKDSDSDNNQDPKKRLIQGALLTILTVVAMVIVFLVVGEMGVLNNSYNTAPDLVKVGGFVLIMGSIETYLLYQIHSIYIRPDENKEMKGYNMREIEGTVLLSKNSNNKECWFQLHPVDSSKERQITIDHFPFVVGSMKEYANGVTVSQAVSRRHAKLDRLGEEIYIQDLNSTNGTYINRKRLKANEKQSTHVGDILQFADVSFRLVG